MDTPFEDLPNPCPDCDSPNQFPAGYFKTRACKECGSEYRAGINGMRQPTKPEREKVVEKIQNMMIDHLKWPELDIDLGGPIVKPDYPTCSFCGRKVDDSTMTRGTAKPQKIVTEEFRQIGDKVEMFEVVKHIAKQVMACPDCSLNIKPIMRKVRDKRTGEVLYEEIAQQGVKFPETEG